MQPASRRSTNTNTRARRQVKQREGEAAGGAGPPRCSGARPPASEAALTATTTVSSPLNLGVNLSPRLRSASLSGRKRHMTLTPHSPQPAASSITAQEQRTTSGRGAELSVGMLRSGRAHLRTEPRGTLGNGVARS